jgi:hypothetical protein
MGIGAVVLGIIALVLVFVPGVGMFAIIPGAVGLALGIAGLVQAGKRQAPKGPPAIGLVLNLVAIVVALAWALMIAGPPAAN